MQEAFRALELFNEKAQILRESRFVQQAAHADAGIVIEFNKEQSQITRTGPDDAAVREFVVTLRFFIQDNEACSLSKMETVYQGLPISDDKKKYVVDVRQYLNRHLDTPSMLRVGNVPITNRRLMDVFVYGNIAHANAKKEEVFKSWKADPIMYHVAYDAFTTVIFQVLQAVAYIQTMNIDILKELEHLMPPAKVSPVLP
jgi:hypothetical protein